MLNERAAVEGTEFLDGVCQGAGDLNHLLASVLDVLIGSDRGAEDDESFVGREALNLPSPQQGLEVL
jgi:hypothetical protein